MTKAERLAEALDEIWVEPNLCHYKVAPKVEGAAAELRRLAAENEALKRELEKAKALPMKYRRMEFNAQLQAENEALRKDAERYRWLRDAGDSTWTPLGKRPGVKFAHEIDAAIDAAMKETP